MKLARTKEWRESHGLTQRELAAEAGVGEVTVARIETGSSVTPPTARKIAEALGVAVADLLERPPVPLGEAPDPGPAVTPDVVDEPEEVPPPELKHDINAAFDRIVAALRDAGAGEALIAEYDGPLRRRALEEVARA